MRSITAEALWGDDSKCLWCSRNIHVSSALQNPIGLAAFEERQMNNQKREEGDPTREELWWREKKERKKVKKRSSLCSAGSLKSFLQQTLVYRHTQRHTGSLSLSSPAFSLPLSLLSPLSSPPHPFIFTLGLLQGSPLSPSTYHSFTVQALISARRKINSILWIHFSSYHGFNNGNKARAFQPHWLASICYS